MQTNIKPLSKGKKLDLVPKDFEIHPAIKLSSTFSSISSINPVKIGNKKLKPLKVEKGNDFEEKQKNSLKLDSLGHTEVFGNNHIENESFSLFQDNDIKLKNLENNFELTRQDMLLRKASQSRLKDERLGKGFSSSVLVSLQDGFNGNTLKSTESSLSRLSDHPYPSKFDDEYDSSDMIPLRRKARFNEMNGPLESKKANDLTKDLEKILESSHTIGYLKDFIIDNQNSSINQSVVLTLLEQNTSLLKQKDNLDLTKKTIAPDETVEASKLKTGEDAVSFFANSGKNTAMKFVYLNRNSSSNSTDYNPYDLIVCSREETDPEYFTMSASGVVHIRPSEPTEFISLSDWMRESTTFNVLRRIRFFKYYLVFKCFKIWHRNARHSKFFKIRSKLSSNLFQGKATFSKTLREIKGLTYKLQSLPIMDFTEKKSQGDNTYNIHEFHELQKKMRQETSSGFENILSKIQQILLQLCKLVTSRAQVDDGFSIDGVSDFLRNDSDLLPKDEQKAMSKRSKSMVQQQREKIELQKSLRKAKREADMLGNFIRLCDYLCVESLVYLAKQTLQRFYVSMINLKAIVFKITIDFHGEKDIKYNPGCEEIMNMFITNRDEIMGSVSKLDRLIYLNDFKIYLMDSNERNNEIKNQANLLFTSNIQSAPKKVFMNIIDTLKRDTLFTSTHKTICSVLNKRFAQALDYGRNFENLKVWYSFGRKWDSSEYSKKQHSVRQYIADLDKVKRALLDLKRMNLTEDFGILVVESRNLKKTLEPLMLEIEEQINTSINETSREMCKKLLTEFRERIKSLKERPSKLQEFGIFVHNLIQVKDESRQMMDQAEEVEKMYELASKNKVQVSSTDLVHLEELKEERDSFVVQVHEAENFREDNILGRTKELEENVSKVNSELFNSMAVLRSGLYVSRDADADDVIQNLNKLEEGILSLRQKTERFSEYKRLFSGKGLEWTNLREVEDQFQIRKEIWTTMSKFKSLTEKWKNTEIEKIEGDDIEKAVNEIFITAHHLYKRTQDHVTEYLKEKVKKWKDRLPVIIMIGNKDLKPYHWQKIFKGMNVSISSTNSYSLKNLSDLGIYDQKELVTEISNMATGEADLQKMLTQIDRTWKTVDFIVKPYRDRKDAYILGSVDDIVQQLEDHIVVLQTMQASPYIAGVKSKVIQWEKKLKSLQSIIEEWMTFQRKWMYLEFIFSSDDISRQLHDEAAKFGAVNSDFMAIMKNTNQNKNAISVVQDPSLLESLQSCNAVLDEVQKNLEDFLGTKRESFPRFFFLSNDELIEILSQTREPRAVQPYLMKCFDSIKYLEFKDETSNEVSGFLSDGLEAEHVSFVESVYAVGGVEIWLKSIESSMQTSIHELLKSSIRVSADVKRENWLTDGHLPSQCIATADMIAWTARVEKALLEIEEGTNRNSLIEYHAELQTLITQLVEIVQRTEINFNLRILVNTLLVLHTHNIEIVKRLIDRECDRVQDFEWQMQLRYYWDAESDNCIIRQTNTEFKYGYEYIGNNNRLVITPLSERCIMTLTGALQMKLGGNPMGPAGTGKTETVRDLSKALARHNIVFNCSEGLGISMLRQMFSGLAQSGAWACFDEFNRIDVEVLSVVAQYMRVIQQALFREEDHFLFDGREIVLNSNYGVFVTMNPDYVGRTELPDNLKSMFRPVAMMIPDYKLIAEVMLYAEGFESASSLAQKMTQLFKLSSDQLSKQHHYDFGMRAIKSILVRAGFLRRRNKKVSEELLLIRAIIDSNTPKLLSNDATIFTALVSDFFPNSNMIEESMEILEKAIANQVHQNHLQIVDVQIYKTIQLFKTMEIRHGVILVGAPGSGKTTSYSLLKSSISQISETGYDVERFHSITSHVLNPKAITMEELYGTLHEVTKEWHDGLVAHLSRIAVREKTSSVHWMIFDGPVDSLWIENMNTVLDDSKMLCLTNGERIKLPQSIKLLFELHDLSVASPATVSRCGVVYYQPEHVGGYISYIQSWLQGLTLPTQYKDQLEFLFEHFISKTLTFIREEITEAISTIDLNLIQSLTRLLDILLTKEHGFDVETGEYIVPKNLIEKKKSSEEYIHEEEEQEEEEQEQEEQDSDESKIVKIDLKKMITMQFIFALVWSLGSSILEEDRNRFDKFIRRLISKVIPDFPEEGLIYDYYIKIHEQKFELWKSKIPHFEFDKNAPFWNILVPTVESIRTQYLMEILIKNGFNILLTGESGVGKSALTEELLRKNFKSGEQGSNYNSILINLSAQTTSKNIIDVLSEKLDQKRKNVLGASNPDHRKICFIDNADMPDPDSFGSQPPLELIRQLIGGVGKRKGFYDLKKMFFKRVEDISFILACAPNGGGRNSPSPRLIRHFNIFNIPNLSKEDMFTVYHTILSGFLFSSKFEESIQLQCINIVQATLGLYQYICSTFLPKPNTQHYTFNLRDVSALIHGIMQVNSNSVNTKEEFINLWVHESSRIFRDRLSMESDRQSFDRFINSIVEKQFEIKNFSSEKILFGDFAQSDGKKYYQPLPHNLEDISKLLRTFFEDYRVEKNMPSLNFVFFEDAIHHLCRLCRILRQPRGNALLIGVAGSGRKTLARFASFIQGYSVFEFEVNKNFKYQHFLDNVKKLLMMAGCEDKPVAMLLSDTQIVDNRILEVIHNILNNGEVPNLFQAEDYEFLIKSIRNKIPSSTSLDSIYKHFVRMIRENLHIILCMSPVSSNFREYIRKFPSFVNNMTIDWYDTWPSQALYSVAKQIFENISSLKEFIDPVCKLSVYIAQTVEEYAIMYLKEFNRKTNVTPSNYLSLLNLYQSMLKDQKINITQMIQRLNKGITKLQNTNEQVALMQIQLKEKQPLLELAVKETMEIEKNLIIDKEKADDVRAICIKEEKECQDAMNELQIIKDSCQSELDEAMPAYHAALKSLKSINRDDIYEIRSFGNPPVLVQTVMEAVCVLFNKKPNWDSSKELLTDVKFLNKLETFEKDHIPEKNLKKLQHYINLDDFDPERVKTVNQASTSLCMWVIAIDGYAKVMKKIEPKRKKLEEAEKDLNKAKNALDTKRLNLFEIEKRIEKLQNDYENAIQRKKDLNSQIVQTKERLERAENLLELLSGERIRWISSVEKLQTDFNNLTGDILLSSGMIAYFGPFNQKYRELLLKTWKEKCIELRIPCSSNFSLLSIVEEVQIRDWTQMGLPNDLFSKQNAILSQKSNYWPLFIDPQGEANNWIRQMEKINGLKVMKEGDPDMMRTLEAAVRVGIPCLIEDVSEKDVDPSLESLLLKQVFKQGGRTLIHLNDQDVDFNRNFKLYMTTRISNPHYSPEMQIKVSLINFTVTMKGLEDQLLSEVVAHEKYDLEKKKNTLITQISLGKSQLKEIEDKILEMLYKESDIHLLDDIALINALKDSKLTAESIQKSLHQAEVTAEQIYESRELYRPVSTRASILYFVISNLSLIDPMYQNSLTFFKQIFRRCLSQSENNDNFEKRIENIINHTTEFTYLTIIRGLFQKDKLLFSFSLTVEILKHSGIITEDEWKFFLGNSIQYYTPSTISFLNDESYTQLLNLSNLSHGFSNVIENMKANPERWKQVIDSESPFEDLLPEPFDLQLSQWKKLLLLKILHPNYLSHGVRKMVQIYMGNTFVVSNSSSINDVYKESNSKTPILFVLSSGVDPLTSFNRFVLQMNYEDKVQYLSLGQGQGQMAYNLIMQASYTGEWVFLQNCHLAISWMPQLEKIVKDLQERDDIHSNFRLYLTSMPSEEVPVTILQNSLKLTSEPPRGLKENLKQSVSIMPQQLFEKKSNVSKSLLFSILLFHGILQERKKFGSIGWNIKYDWNYSDLEASFRSFDMLLPSRRALTIPWNAFKYIISVIHFGGRVTDFLDLKCVETIFNDLFNEKVLELDFNYGDEKTIEYVPPKESFSFDDLKNYISTLPDIENPRILGLHENASIFIQIQENEILLESLKHIQPSEISHSNDSTNPSKNIAKFIDRFEKQLPQLINVKNSRKDLFKTTSGGFINSIGTFLQQEIFSYNQLLQRVKTTLDELKKALNGIILMSPELEEMYNDFKFERVPSLWKSISYPSTLTLTEWIDDLCSRVEMIQDWLKNGHPSSRCYRLGAFFYPQSFLTSILQAYSRKNKTPIDALTFKAVPLSEIRQSTELTPQNIIHPGSITGSDMIPRSNQSSRFNSFPTNLEDGVVIEKLILECASWDSDKMQLTELEKGALQSEMPLIHLIPCTKDELLQELKITNHYECPLYRTANRSGALSSTGISTNYVMPLYLKSGEQLSTTWTKRSVSMLCSK